MRQPLNLPAGSVRALLAFGVVGSACALAAMKVNAPEIYTLAGIVLRDYFHARETETAALPQKEARDVQ